DTWSSTTRATVSLALPAVNGLITNIERLGQDSARVDRAKAIDPPAMSTAPAMAPHRVRSDVIRTSLDVRSVSKLSSASFQQMAHSGYRPGSRWQRRRGARAAVARRRRCASMDSSSAASVLQAGRHVLVLALELHAGGERHGLHQRGEIL